MALTKSKQTPDWTSDPSTLSCVDCEGTLVAVNHDGLVCSGCGRNYPIREGVLVVKDQPTADNRIAADFYNSALWPKFRFWEWFFFVCNGGERRSRNIILDHLPKLDGLNLLDVAIGDGVYLGWLPTDWDVVGIDVSTSQLASCRRRNPNRDMRLVLGEAEALPFQDRSFDAVLSIGGFNHFNDPEQALKEMVRVVRPGSTIVISDEMPDMTNRMIGHRLGLPGFDRWVVSKLMHLGDDFTDLVERHRDIDIAAIGQRNLKNSHYETIWRGGGYLMVGQAP
ncbi:methyltransferase domain-containing protein [Singulisphaera rosea]